MGVLRGRVVPNRINKPDQHPWEPVRPIGHDARMGILILLLSQVSLFLLKVEECDKRGRLSRHIRVQT